MQEATERPDLRLLTTEKVTYLSLLKNGNFLRFFLAQFVSSLGDWIGVFALAVYAKELGGAAGVGTVLTARVLPGFVVGPLAGVIADRWDRKRTMIVADITRALIIFSLPFFPDLIYLVLASAALESLTLIWGPAKDASLPHFVPASHLTHANSLNLLAVYAPWPLASLVFLSLVTLATFLGSHVPALAGLSDDPEALALWLDAGTFAFSAVMIGTLTIPTSVRRAGSLDLRLIRRDLVEGVKFVIKHKQVRPWILGIAFTFTAAGGVFSLGLTFAEQVLVAGPRGFASIVGFLATGMIIGLLAVGFLSKRIQKDVIFSSSIFLLGAGLIALASVNSLEMAIPIASALGFFGGAAYSTGYALIHEATADEVRGRTFSAAYTVIRIGTLVGLGLFPLIAAALGEGFDLGDYEVPGSRLTFWIAGTVALGGAVLSMRAIGARTALERRVAPQRGFFVVFEGGEGAGKTTQMTALVEWLEARGERVVTTREPGGTAIGDRIRGVLLDPASARLDPRAEALLYAADRAQHVAEVIKPALDAGFTVVSDRFIDSSLAYQGIGRDLGLREIYELSEWATGGVLPDLVFYLKLDPDVGLDRVADDLDRIEKEDGDFHARVAAAYAALARRFSDRFAIIDVAGLTPAQVHAEVTRIFEERRRERESSLQVVQDLGAPGPPVAR